MSDGSSFGNMVPSVRSTFAANLRALCDTRDSVAAVCRDLGINRQQFARYLSGQSLPNAANLQKIATYFLVDQDVLFVRGTANPDTSPDGLGSRLGKRLVEILGGDTIARLPGGAYWCDYASPTMPEHIVRAVVFVEHLEGVTTFKRLTGFGERKNTWWAGFRGEHEGLVVERRGTFFLTGLNTSGLGEPSILVVRPSESDDFVLAGTATIMSGDGAEVMAVVLSQAPKGMSLVRMVKRSRAYPMDTPDISMRILGLLSRELDRLADNYAKPSAAKALAQ